MNRLNQTEPATFLILLCWAFFRDSVFLYFKATPRANSTHLLELRDVKTPVLYIIIRLCYGETPKTVHYVRE
jgi:hypothetical protein